MNHIKYCFDYIEYLPQISKSKHTLLKLRGLSRKVRGINANIQFSLALSLFFHSQRSPLVSFFVWTAVATTTKEDFKIVSKFDKLIDKFLVLLIGRHKYRIEIIQRKNSS